MLASDSLIELVKLCKTVQKRTSASNILNLQMYWKPTSSCSCGEMGPEKAVESGRDAIVPAADAAT